MGNFFKNAFHDMKEDAKAQHAVDKARFEAVKAESKAQWEEAKAMGKPQTRKAMMQAEREAQIAAAEERRKEAQARIDAVAVYYILLAVMRFLLLRQLHSGKQDKVSEYRRYRLTASLMLLINLTLSVIVLDMILKHQPDTSSDVVVITSAAYTFYTLTVSIMDIVKYRKYESPVLSAAKAIRFAAALVSLLSLEASMLLHFGQDESFRRRMLALTGAGVCTVVVAMSVCMIVRSTKKIKDLRSYSNG